MSSDLNFYAQKNFRGENVAVEYKQRFRCLPRKLRACTYFTEAQFRLSVDQ